MNIVYLSHSDLFSNKANVVHVLNMCAALIRNGHKVKLFVWKNKKYKLLKTNYQKILNSFDINGNIEIFNYPNLSKFGNSYLLSLYLCKKLNLTNIDFIISRNLRLSFSFRHNIPIFYETHQPYKYYNFIDKIIFNNLIKGKKFMSLITISEYLINDYNKISKFINIKKILLRDASNLNINTNIQRNINSNIKSIVSSVGYIGSLYEGRGIEIIVKLSNIMKNVSFNIVGGTSEEIMKYQKSSINNNLIFHGHLDYKSSIKIMSNFDILIAPYQSHTTVPGGMNTSKWMSPIKLFEYMSVNKPIITSEINSLKEFMTDQRNCLLVKEDNLNEWKDAINLLIRDKKLSNKIASNAFNDLKNKYTWDIRVKKIIDKFTNVDKKF